MCPTSVVRVWVSNTCVRQTHHLRGVSEPHRWKHSRACVSTFFILLLMCIHIFIIIIMYSIFLF